MTAQHAWNVTTEKAVNQQDIADWVITAFEGGITYWCDKAEAVKRDESGQWVRVLGDDYNQWLTEDSCSPYANPEFWFNDSRGYRLYDPYDEKWVEKVLTASALIKAFKYQPPKNKHMSPNWFRKVCDRMLSEDYDAGDADTLVQVAVFNELVYG